MSNADTLYISAGEQIYINGNMEVQNGATIINNSLADIDLRGTASINGQIDYTASGDQNILPYNHQALRINGSGNKKLASDIIITNYLQLGGTAKLVTNNYLLSLPGSNAAIINDASFGNNASSWIVTGNGNEGIGNTGLGAVQIGNIGSGGRNGNIFFPVGPSTLKYNPLTLSNTGTTDDFTVSVNDQVVPGADVNKSVSATWKITEGNIGGSDLALGTQWTAADEGADFIRNACSNVHSNGAIIDYHSVIGSANGLDPFSRTGTGFTNFSLFGVTSDALVLPVTFIRLIAYLQQEKVQVAWDVAAETGISYYEVQKSNSNSNFVAIGNVAALGNNSSMHYNLVDESPFVGVNYYRIRSIGIDGAFKYSSIAKVNYAGKPGSIVVYPNPVVASRTALQFKNKAAGIYYISIRSNTGALVYQTQIRHSGGDENYFLTLPNTLASEVYQMIIDGPGGSKSQIKIMVQN